MARKRGRPAAPPTTDLGRRVARLLAEHEELHTVQDLSKKIGGDRSNLDKVLRRQGTPTLRVLREIAKALGCGVADLAPPEDFSNDNAPYRAWREFRSTQLGQGMTDDERAELGRMRFLFREPTPELYAAVLLNYRSMSLPMRPPLALCRPDDDEHQVPTTPPPNGAG